MSPGDAERAYQVIRCQIIEGVYLSGARLVEQQIADHLHMSRTPVREALRRLESEGLIVVERNRGAHVRRLSRVDIVDLYEVRARLEAYVAEVAARRAQPDQVAALRDAAADFERVAVGRHATTVGQAEARELMAANTEFHDQLLACGSSPGALGLLDRAVDLPLVFESFRSFGVVELRRSSMFHHLIADAVASGEPERAGRLTTEHVLQGRDVLINSIDPTGPVKSTSPAGTAISHEFQNLLEVQ